MRALGPGWQRVSLEVVLALGFVGVVSLVLDAVDADQTVAALSLVVLAVFLTFVGTTAVIVGVVRSFASLNSLFTPTRGEFGIANVDDLVALVALRRQANPGRLVTDELLAARLGEGSRGAEVPRCGCTSTTCAGSCTTMRPGRRSS